MKLTHRKVMPVRNAGLTVGVQEMDATALRATAKSEPALFVRKLHDIVNPGEGEEGLTWRKVRNVATMQDALADCVVPAWDNTSKRLVDTSAFQALTSNLTVAGVNAAYLAVPTIGQELVTELDDSKKITSVIGIVSLDDTGGTDPWAFSSPEGKAFVPIGAGEERFFVLHDRKGARITITQELFDENDLPGIIARVDALGEIMAEQIEKQTLRSVCDIDGSGTAPAEPYVLRPGGGPAGSSPIALYQTDNDPQDRLHSDGNRVINNTLVDGSDIENARLRLAGATNSRGEKISVLGSEAVLLVPDALWLTAWKIRNSILEPGVWNEKNFYGLEGPFPYRILTSPKLDDLSTDVWYLMASAVRQFIRKWKLRPETVVLPGTSPGAAQSFLDARIGYQARVAWDMMVGAQDQGVYVTQNLTGTTAP